MSGASSDGIDVAGRWSLRLLGAFELRAIAGGERVALPGKRERLLLAYLALSPKGRESRSKLAALLWGDAGEETALDNLRTCLWALRKALRDAKHRVLASDGDDVVLDLAAFDVDALALRRIAAASNGADVEAAAALYAGELLAGLDVDSEEFESWRRAEAARCREQALAVLAQLMAQRGAAKEADRAIETGHAILALEPLHEDTVRRLMRLYAGSGRRTAAILAYRSFAETLRAELDVEPEAATLEVLAEVGRGGAPSVGAAAQHAVRADPDEQPPQPLAAASSAPRPRFRASVAAAAGVLLLAVAAVGWWRLVVVGSSGTDGTASDAGLRVVSIAVLPFANLSGDPAQEFFSDGMTEEITDALVRVPQWRVVARRSAFQFKGQARDVRAVGRSLGASHLVEGSVRRDGARVRVSAQLVEASTGTHLWAQSYDGELTDGLALQDDIARAIATALQIPLGRQRDGAAIVGSIMDVETYEMYLRARALVHVRGFQELTQAAALLEQVVAQYPDYAPAWAALAQAYGFIPNFNPAWFSGEVEGMRRVAGAAVPKAEAAARRAIELDPSLADGYALLANTQDLRRHLVAAEDLYRQALALDPNNPDALHLYSRLLAQVGRLKESYAMRQQLRAVDPFVPVYNSVTSWLMWLNGETEAAIALGDSTTRLHRGYGLPRLLAAAGRYAEAADVVSSIPEGTFLPGTVEEAAGLLRTAPARVASPETLPRLGLLDFVYLYVGAPDRVLDFYEAGVEADYTITILYAFLWHPSYAEVRNTERFAALMRNAGMVDYWRARGWPDFCRPAAGDEPVCE